MPKPTNYLIRENSNLYVACLFGHFLGIKLPHFHTFLLQLFIYFIEKQTYHYDYVVEQYFGPKAMNMNGL